MFKINNKDTRTTPTNFTPCFNVSTANFGHVIADWVNKWKQVAYIFIFEYARVLTKQLRRFNSILVEDIEF